MLCNIELSCRSILCVTLSAKQCLLISVCSHAVCSLSLEHDRRLVEERNEAMGLLFRDIQDLNSIARDMAVHVDEQQDTIGN